MRIFAPRTAQVNLSAPGATLGLWMLAAAAALVLGHLPASIAEEFRYFQQNGITYRDRIVNVPVAVPETSYQDRQETVYREQHLPALRTETRTTYVPVVTYHLETRSTGIGPWATQPPARWVPRTQWVPQVQQVQIPVHRKQQIPETRTVRAAQVTMRYVNQPQIVERMVMGPGFVPPATDPNASGQALAAAPSLAPPSDVAGTVPGAGAPGSLAPGGLAPAGQAPNLAPVPPGTVAQGPSTGSSAVGTIPQGQSVLAGRPAGTAGPPIAVNGIQPYGAAVGGAPYGQPTYRPGWYPPANVARRESVGGISRMENDPPRYAAPVAPAPVPSANGAMYR